MLTFESKKVNKFWRRNPISSKSMPFRCMFLDLHLIAHHLIMIVYLKGKKWIRPTYLREILQGSHGQVTRKSSTFEGGNGAHQWSTSVVLCSRMQWDITSVSPHPQCNINLGRFAYNQNNCNNQVDPKAHLISFCQGLSPRGRAVSLGTHNYVKMASQGFWIWGLTNPK